jgi:hypothetical protein
MRAELTPACDAACAWGKDDSGPFAIPGIPLCPDTTGPRSSTLTELRGFCADELLAADETIASAEIEVPLPAAPASAEA